MHGIRAMLSRRAWLVLVVVTAGVLGSAGVASAANTYTVNDPNDYALSPSNSTTCQSSDPTPPTSGDTCTLRAAVQAADNAGGQSTINVPANTYKLTIAPSMTTSPDPSTGDLDITSGAFVNVVGAGSGKTIVNANGIDRAFAVQGGARLALTGLAIENGVAESYENGSSDNCNDEYYSSGYHYFGPCGGAIYSDGQLNLTSDVVLSNNSAYSTEVNNHCCYDTYGGVIYADSDTGSSLYINGATFSNNTADYGGAISDYSAVPESITGSSFSGNAASNDGGALYQEDSANSPNTVTGSSFSANSAGGYGGTVYSQGGPMTIDTGMFTGNDAYYAGVVAWYTGAPLQVTNSTFASNIAVHDGVLSANCDGESITLSSSRFTGNEGGEDDAVFDVDPCSNTGLTLKADEFDSNSSPGGQGIGSFFEGTLHATDSSFIGNSGADGGLMTGDATLDMTNVTMSKNSATDGGALYIDYSTSVSMNNDTIAYNSARQAGGGIYGTSSLSAGSNPNGFVNTIIAENSGGDCSDYTGSSNPSQVPIAADAGYNLDSDGSCFKGDQATDKVGVNPRLAQPADNGGPAAGLPGATETIQTDAETAGSPAIDAGTLNFCPATDARGVPRPQGAGCDIGAYESQAAGLTLTKSGPSSAETGVPFNYTLSTTATGPGSSTGTTVVDQLPANTTLYGVSASQGSCTSSGSPAKVTCSLGSVANGSTATATLVVAVTQAGTVTNTATASNDQGSSSTGSVTTVVSNPGNQGGKPTAVTGPATAIGKKSAKLTGAVATGGQSTSYFFQYGRTNRYGNSTPVTQTGTANQTVGLAIRNLTSSTKYHFRLVAINSSGASYGKDRTFRTKGKRFLGRLLLIGRTVTTKNGGLSATFKCASGKACFGLFTVTAHITVAKTHRQATVVCTKSRFAKYRIRAHKTVTVTVPVHAACVSEAQAHGGRLGAKLTTRPRSAQQGLIKRVTLVVR